MYRCKTLIASNGDTAAQEKRLSICLGANGFSFSETAVASGMLLTFGEAEGEHAATITDATRDVKALFAEIGMRPLGYKAMELIVMSDESTWVPDELYSVASNRQYLKLVGGKELSLMTCHSSAIGSTAVFACNDQLVMGFKVALPGLTVMNQHAKIVKLKEHSKSHPLLFAYWRSGCVDVAACKDGRYLFGNTLHCGSNEEAVFRLMEVVKSCDIGGNNTELLLCGDVDRELFAALRPYFPKTTLYGGEVTGFGCDELKKFRSYKYALTLL